MQGKRTILGTATPGGGFPLYGGVFAEALNAADPATGLRVIAAMYSSPGMFVVRADSPVRVIADLKGQTVAFGAKGSGLTILGRTVIDGRVAALWGAGIGWPGFTAVASSAQGARFIVPDAAEIARILAKHPFLKPLTIAAGSYPGQAAPIPSVGSWSYVLSRPGLDEGLAYRLASALHKSEAALAAKLEQARETTAANTLAAAPHRELIHLIGITAASNRPAELRVHVQGALANGCTPEQIREVLLLVTMYCGIPAGNDAHRVAYEVIEENAGRKAP